MLGKSKLRANRSKGSAREKLAEAEIHELKKAFDLFDEGEKGTIEPAEIKKIL